MRIPVQQFEINLPFKEPALLAEAVHHKQGLRARLSISVFIHSAKLLSNLLSSIGVIKAT